jgi:riboflavin biosynthesis pyrimidine reductase
MGKLPYSATMSLEGFNAGPGGDMSWLAEHLGPGPTVEALIGEIGALLVGNRTFRGDDPHRGTPEEGKAFGGGWSAGTDRQCLDAGVLDEIFVCVAPVLLGDGVRLFDRPGGTNVKLERLSVTQAPGATNLRLRVLR